MKPALLILAAGMGSRYGGLKQIDGIGPNDEPIIEYSIYDAIKSIPKPDIPSFKIGITGSPGVGKSTFIETFGKYLGE